MTCRWLSLLTYLVLVMKPSLGVSSDFQTARVAALGGAGHAGPLFAESIYLNPSFASYYPQRIISSHFQSYDGVPNPDGRLFNVSVADGTAPLFQAGVGYTHRDDGRVLHFGASKSVQKQIGIGIGYKLFLDQRGDSPRGSDATLSSTYFLNPWLTLALVIDNVFRSEAGRARNAPREIILGTKINLNQILLVYFDPHWHPDRGSENFGHETGLEIPFYKDFFLRAGAFRNAYVPMFSGIGDGVGAGVGWIGPKIVFDYGFKRITGSKFGLPSATSHLFGLTVFF